MQTLDVRVLRAKALEHGRQQQVRRAARGADTDHAIARAQHLRHLVGGLARLAGDELRAPQKCLAIARQHHAARGACQQRHMQFFFEQANALGDGRTRDIAGLGAGPDAAGLGHGNEVLKLAQAHEIVPSGWRS